MRQLARLLFLFLRRAVTRRSAYSLAKFFTEKGAVADSDSRKFDGDAVIVDDPSLDLAGCGPKGEWAIVAPVPVVWCHWW